jgi:hypothetical protein
VHAIGDDITLKRRNERFCAEKVLSRPMSQMGLRLTVSDDGKGFDPRRTDSGTGAGWSRSLRDTSAAMSSGSAATKEPSCV